jgi:arsenate reductase
MNERLKIYMAGLENHFQEIPQNRKQLLQKLIDYLHLKLIEKHVVSLVFICTHNSRRSHFGQIWAKTAAVYYGLKGISTYSGGTEETSCHPNTLDALERAGFEIKKHSDSKNPEILVVYDDQAEPIVCFSKTYDHPGNPSEQFAAILTCADADENCPFIPGADVRIPLTYEDPKKWDNTGQKETKYDERCREIALEMMYTFSSLQKKQEV